MTTSWDRFQDDIQTTMLAGASEERARLTWGSDQIHRSQRNGLHTLLRHAADHSPFHRRRLAGVDLAAVDPSDLSALPVMTKSEMMDGLDDVFTDRRLRCRDVEAALAVTGAQPVPILDDYVALASGGCSGRRGLFVFDRAAMTSFFTAVVRRPLAAPPAPAVGWPGGLRIAMVAAPSAVHATGFTAALTSSDGWPQRFELVPATLPPTEIVERLNTMQPHMLGGYASMLARLAPEARAGRLQITPAVVGPTSETLLPEMRAVISEAFGVPVLDGFACSEGLVGKAAPDDDVFVFNTDMCIVELVDADNRLVPPGVPSAKVLVTNLYNLTQPLIRYELNDVFVRQPDAAHHGYLRARVQGRSDDVLRYDTADVHPIAIRSVMIRSSEVIDYQVHQIPSGIDVFVVATDRLDVDELTVQLQRALAGAGLDRPQVAIKCVDQLERNFGSGKLRRFVPLGPAGTR
jgi:phenylacetate-coenzyme A ligase PaaK-like adenylate-forming protein